MWKIRLCHATDFQSLMYPCFIFCRIIGIFPYKINASTIEISKLRYIWATFLLCASCIDELHILHEIIIRKTLNFGDVTHTLEDVFYFTLAGFIVIITYIISGPRMRILQAMLEISLRLPPKSYQELSRWIHVKDILGTIFIFTQEWIFNFERDYHSCFPIMPIYVSIVVFLMDMQYMNCICVLKTCFKRINDNLIHIQKIVANDEPYAPRLISHMQNNQFLLMELKILKKQYLIISNTVQMLNETFSLHLLLTITLTFTEMVFEAYFFLIQWQNSGLSSILNNFSEMILMTLIVHVILKLMLIVWACETNKNQAFEIGTTVHEILNCTSDKQIKKELRLFSLQILHCKKTFCTKGLSVDATLLTAMIGNVTTYILILTQFMLMSRSCDGKSVSNITQEITV